MKNSIFKTAKSTKTSFMKRIRTWHLCQKKLKILLSWKHKYLSWRIVEGEFNFLKWSVRKLSISYLSLYLKNNFQIGLTFSIRFCDYTICKHFDFNQLNNIYLFEFHMCLKNTFNIFKIYFFITSKTEYNNTAITEY